MQHELSISDRKTKICSLPRTLHISIYLLNLQFQFLMTGTVRLKLGALKYLTNFTEKHLCWSIFNKVEGLEKNCKIFKNSCCFRTTSVASSVHPILETCIGRIGK